MRNTRAHGHIKRTVAVYGLGYVGTVTAGCLAAEGHHVIGVDVDNGKVDLINGGKSPIREPGTDAIIAEAVASGFLQATTEANGVSTRADLSIICVGTPSARDGRPDYQQIERVCRTIGLDLPRDRRHVVAIRSTILPGTSRDLIVPALERASKMDAGVGFGLAHIPEFLREGSAIEDYLNPPQTVIGADDEETSALLADLFSQLPGPKVRVPVEIAEAVKLSANVWRALKVSFANELGAICREVGIDSHDVMDVFFRDTRHNISASYLTPGYAFGGSCLPKDTRGLAFLARREGVSAPVIDSILPSNRDHVLRALDTVIDLGHRRVGVLGCSFKPFTDDLRESPIVELIERLIGKGYEVSVYDPNVQAEALVGSNRHFTLERIPHISSIMVPDLETLIERCDLVVVGTNDPRFAALPSLVRDDQTIVDLVRLNGAEAHGNYHGICW